MTDSKYAFACTHNKISCCLKNYAKKIDRFIYLLTFEISKGSETLLWQFCGAGMAQNPEIWLAKDTIRTTLSHQGSDNEMTSFRHFENVKTLPRSPESDVVI